jgi:ABC-type sulfate transport system permease component
MTFTAFLTEAISLLVGAIKGIGQGIGEGITSIVRSLIFETVENTTSMSAFASLAFLLCGIALAFTLTRWVLNFFTSMGNRNR